MTDLEQEYYEFLQPHLAPGFAFREIVNGNRTHQMPPRRLWSRMVRPLYYANLLRRVMMALGAKGLLVNAAYRPVGGAATSMHKLNAALDLDLFPSDYNLSEDYATEAVRMFCENAPSESLGLGVYGRKGSCATIRVHWDVGKSLGGGDRGWQIVGSREYGMRASDIAVIAKREGLVLP